MRRIFTALFALVILAGLSGTAQAQIEKYVLDKPHTQIMFSIDHLGFSRSSGKFTDYAGEIMWDKGEPEKSSVNVTIQTASLDLGDATWNEHTTSPRFFDAAQFPTMTFKSTSIQKTGDNTANITGDLTLHGVTKPVTLAAMLRKEGKHPMAEKMAAGFAATAKIKRSDFGMSEAVPFVGDDVDITIEVEAYQDDPTAGGTGNK
jgi:polyisoprenoid-binding protein YceI